MKLTKDDYRKIIEMPPADFLRLLNLFKEARIQSAKCPMCSGIEFVAAKQSDAYGSFYGIVSAPWQSNLTQILHVYLISCIKCGFMAQMNYEPMMKWLKENGHG